MQFLSKFLKVGLHKILISISFAFSISACSGNDKQYINYKQQTDRTAAGKVTLKLVVNELDAKSEISVRASLDPNKKLAQVKDCAVHFIDFTVRNESKDLIISAFQESADTRVNQGNYVNSDLGVFLTMRGAVNSAEDYTTYLEFELTPECGVSPKTFYVKKDFEMRSSKLNWLERFLYSQ